MLSVSGLGKKGRKAIIDLIGLFFGGHRAIGLNAMLEAIKLPAGIALNKKNKKQIKTKFLKSGIVTAYGKIS
jgi:hypothetical protein